MFEPSFTCCGYLVSAAPLCYEKQAVYVWSAVPRSAGCPVLVQANKLVFVGAPLETVAEMFGLRGPLEAVNAPWGM